ncbi:MAG: InlB B-repeat-containing protein [Treponema sp.]|nr:InlB B-repeat-containing protein [Treponema sp.]
MKVINLKVFFRFCKAAFLSFVILGIVSCSDYLGEVQDSLDDIEVTYKVEHWKQDPTGKFYEKDASATQTLKGMSLAQTEAECKDFDGFYCKSINQEKIKRNGSTVVKIYYDRDTITYTFKTAGGRWSDSSEEKTISGLYGSVVPLPVSPDKTGYVFSSWDENVPATFGLQNKEYTAVWAPGTGTLYKVEHWQQNIDDDEYSIVSSDTENMFGTTDSPTEAVAKNYIGFDAKDITQGLIAPDGSTVIKLYYDRKIITYTFTAGGGNWNGDSDDIILSGKFGASFISPENPVRTGYGFDYWNTQVPLAFGHENTTFTAIWLANTDTHYRVDHWQQNVTGNEYTKIESQDCTGTTATQTEASAKTYTGFNSKSFDQIEIAADGTAVVAIYYDRIIVDYAFNSGEGKFNDNTTNKIVSGRYGATVNKPADPIRTGYTFRAWNSTVPSTFGTQNLSFSTSWTPNTNTKYTVEHWQQNIYDNDYSKYATQNMTGTTATQTSAAAINYDGFTSKSFNQTEIAADGSAVVKIYYDRKNITYSFSSGEGKFADNTTSKTISGRYGATVNAPASPSRTGYSFGSWSLTVPATFGPSNLSFSTNWNPNTNTPYIVEHWQQNLADNNYTKYATQNLTGTTATQTSAAAINYDGFTSKSFNQTEIAADGTSVIKIYYDRKTITYTFSAGSGKFSDNTTSKTCSGRYGASFTKPGNPSRTGYTFSSWSATVPSTFGPSSTTFTSVYTANKYTIKYNANGGSGSMSDQSFSYGTAQNLTANGFSRVTWDFAGWNTASNGSGTSYSAGQSVNNLTATNNATITLYAMWTYPNKLKFTNETLAYVCDNISLVYSVTFTASKGNYSKTYTYNSGAAIPGLTLNDVPNAALANGVTWTMSVTAVNSAHGIKYTGTSTAKISNNKLNLTFPSMTRAQ